MSSLNWPLETVAAVFRRFVRNCSGLSAVRIGLLSICSNVTLCSLVGMPGMEVKSTMLGKLFEKAL